MASYRVDLQSILCRQPEIGHAGLEDLHPNPADRLIVATASLRPVELVTADEWILTWRGPLRTRDARR